MPCRLVEQNALFARVCSYDLSRLELGSICRKQGHEAPMCNMLFQLLQTPSHDVDYILPWFQFAGVREGNTE